MAITSLFRIPLQAVKKQNIVYSGRLSVTNALPVFYLSVILNNGNPVKEKRFLPVLKAIPVLCRF